MASPPQNRKKMIKKAVTFNGRTKPCKKTRKSSSQKKKKQKVKRESVLKPSVYRQIQKKRKSQALCKTESINTPKTNITAAIQGNEKKNITNTKYDNKRNVFISIRDFYQCWRSLPAHILFDAILIFPLYREWIVSPKQCMQYKHNFTDILCDNQFVTLLQWKDRQGLAFFMLSHVNRKTSIENLIKCQHGLQTNEIAPFWHYLSYKLESLYDPDTFDSYRPLLLNERWWKYAYTNMYYSKYNVSQNEILNELHFLTMKFKCIQEILYQSNPSLNVVIKYRNNCNKHNQQLIALQSIKSILKEQPQGIPTLPIKHMKNMNNMNQMIDSNNNEYNDYNEYSHEYNDPLQSNDSSDDIIVNSGSDDNDIKINYNTNDKSSSTEQESISSSTHSHATNAMFAHMVNNNYNNNAYNNSNISLTNSSKVDTLDDMEWWVCPDYYYDTYKNNSVDTDCDTDY